MTDDVKAVVERVAKDLAERAGFTWTNERVLMTGRGGSRTRPTFEREAAEIVALPSFQALLSERRKMVEAVNLLRRIREGLWIQPQHWNIHDQPRVHELLAEIDAALSGSADNAR